MSLHDVFCDGKPQPGPAAGPGPIALVETLEQTRQVLACHAGPRVGDKYPDVTRPVDGADDDSAARRRVLDRIVHEIYEHLLDSFRIDVDRACLAVLDDQVDTLSLGEWGEVVDGGPHHIAHLDAA